MRLSILFPRPKVKSGVDCFGATLTSWPKSFRFARSAPLFRGLSVTKRRPWTRRELFKAGDSLSRQSVILPWAKRFGAIAGNRLSGPRRPAGAVAGAGDKKARETKLS